MYRFLDRTLDVANARLRHGGATVTLRPKTLAILQHLIDRPQALVAKAELLAAVWPDTAVSDWVLTTAIRDLRAQLGDDARQPRIIETVHRRGYRFIAPVRLEPAAAATITSGDLVGRDRDLATLAEWWQRAAGGARQVGFVLGEAGIGKSVLVDAFVAHLQSEAAGAMHSAPLLARGQCIEQHSVREPYAPLLEALGKLCTTAPNGPDLVDALHRHAPAWLAQLPGLLAPEANRRLEKRIGDATSRRMLREFAGFLSALPAPLLLVIEDLHWSDPSTLDAITMMAQRRDPVRLMVLGTYRPVEAAVGDHPLRAVHQSLRARGHCHDLWLAPLDEESVHRYLHARWPGIDGAEALARQVHAHTDGHPLFLVHTAEFLEADGTVVSDADGWRVHGDPGDAAFGVPDGLRRLIAAQSEALHADDRGILEAASLAGRSFPASLVAAALDAEVVLVEGRLERLAESGRFVGTDGAVEWPDGTLAGGYRFNHFLYQSVVRERVPPARARQWHRRLAERLERAYAGSLADAAGEIASHWEAGGEAERAVPHWERCASRAFARGASREAESFVMRGLALLEPLPETPERASAMARLRLKLGRALAPRRGFADPAIEREYERALRISEAGGDPGQHLHALCALAVTYLAQGRLAELRDSSELLRKASALASARADVFVATLIRGMIAYHSGDLGEARELLQQVVRSEEVALPIIATDLRVVADSYLGITAVHLGFPDQGRAHLRAAVDRAAASERAIDRGFAAQMDCYIQLLLHDMDALAQAGARAASLDELPAISAVGRLACGRALVSGGRGAEGIAAMRAALAAYRETGQRIGLPALMVGLASGLLEAGETTAARECIQEALAYAESIGDLRQLPELYRLVGVHASADRRSAARQLRHAVALARRFGARWSELRATTSQARLALAPGVRAATRRTCAAALAAILSDINEGADTADVCQAREVLASLHRDVRTPARR